MCRYTQHRQAVPGLHDGDQSFDVPYASCMNPPTPTTLLRAASIAAALVVLPAVAPAQTMQEHVHGHGHEVMPFDLAKTVHVFRMTEDGGTQQVVVRSNPPDAQQVHMIQHHLMMEAAEFQKGNFADPAYLHGATMPGLAEMRAGAAGMQISYVALPNGGEIRFRATDIKRVTAVHRWFGAQLSEHGADARAE